MACKEEVVKKLSGLPPVIDVITRSKNLNNTAPADSEGAINKFMGLANKYIFDVFKTKPTPGIQSIPAVLFKKENRKYLKSYLESIDIDGKAADAMISEWTSYRISSENISKPRKHDTAKIATGNPLDLITDKEGNLPPNVAFASMLAIADWAHKHPSNTVFINNYSREVFMHVTGQGAKLSKNEIEQMNEIGHSFKDASTEIGNIALKLLGMSGINKNLGTEQYKENIIPALGMYALMTAHFKPKESQLIDVQTHQWSFDSDSPTRKFKSNTPYNHIKITKNKRSIKNNELISKAIPGIAKGEDVSSTADILQKPATAVPQFVRNFLGKIPRKIQDTIRKKQQQEWTTSSAIAPLTTIKNLGNEGIKLLHELAGVVSEDDLGYKKGDVFHPYNKAHYVSVTASNDDKKNALEELFAANETEDTPLTKFYFKYGLAITNRALQVGSKIFPQNSHIHRAFVQPVGSTEYNNANMHLFKLAVLYNIGFSIDKAIPEEILSKFDKVQEDANLLAAINELNKGTKANGKEIINNIREFYKTHTGGKPGNNIKILTAIQAMSKYIAAGNGIENKDKYNKFTSDITLEIDGITNGFAMTLLQFPMRSLGATLERRLNQVGVYLDKFARHRVDGTYATDNSNKYDTYNDFAELVNEFSSAETASEYILTNKKKYTKLIEKYGKNKLPLVNHEVFEKNFTEAFDKQNDALYSIFPFADENGNLLREVVKYPFMIFNYGGGIKAITTGVASDVVKKVHETLNTLVKDFEGDTPKDSAKELISFLNTAEEAGVAFTVKPNLSKLKDRLNEIMNTTGDPEQKEINAALFFLNQLEVNEEISLPNISEILIPRFDLALTEMLGPIQSSTAQANQIAELMFSIFKAKLNIAVESKLKELNKKHGTNIKTLPDKEVALIAKELERYIPRYSGALENSPVSANKVSEVFTDLLTSSVDRDDTSSKSAVTVEYTPNAPETIKSKSMTPVTKRYESPGASAVIRAIINKEASVMSETEGLYTNVLTTFDGVLGQPETLEKFSKEYGKNFLKLSRDVSIMQDMLDTLNANIAELEKTGEWKSIKRAADAWMLNNSFASGERSKHISFDVGLSNVIAKNEEVQADRKALFERMDKETVVAHQMFFTDMYPDFTLRKLTAEENLEKEKRTYFFENSEYVKNIDQEARNIANAAVEKGIGKDEKDPYLFNLNIAKDAAKKVKQRLFETILQAGGVEKAIQLLSVLNERSLPHLLRLTKETAEYIALEAFLDKLESTISTNKLIKATLIGGAGVAEIDAIQGKNKIELDRLKLALQDKFEIYHTLGDDAEMRINFEHKDGAHIVELDQLANEFITPDKLGERAETNEEAIERDIVQELLDNNFDIDKVAPKDEGVGTLGPELERINPVETHSSTVTSNTINKLFHKFQEISAPYYKSKESKAAHTNSLEKVLSAISAGLNSVSNINLSVEKIDGITQGNYLPVLNRVRVSLSRKPPLAVNGSTPQEVYVHEMLHALLKGTIKENPLLVIQLRKLFQQTKKEFDSSGKHQVFLEGIDNPTEHDIAMAKEQYSYVFEQTKKSDPQQLEEFLVYAVTNRHMISYLSNTHTKLPVRNKKLLGKLQHMLDVLIDLAIKLLSKKFSRGSTAYADALATMEYLIEAQNKNERLAESYSQGVAGKITAGDNRIKEWISKKSEEILNADSNSKLAKIRNSAIGAAGIYLNDNTKIQAIRQKLGSILGKTARSVYNNYGKGVLSPALTMLLLQSKNLVGKTTQTTSRMSVEWFNEELWKSTKGKDIDHYTKNALTNVLLRTGLSGLLNAQMQPIDIFNLLGSAQNIKQQKDAILKYLKLTVKDKAIQYAEELGIHAATGDSDANLGQLHDNGHTIAMQHMQNTVVQDAAKYLEAYATLIALEHTDRNEIDAVKKLSAVEFNKDAQHNGMTEILRYHAIYNEKVLKDLFKGNPTQMRFGYIIEKVDNLHGMVIGKVSEEEAKKKEGYTEMYPLGDLGGISESDNAIFVGHNMPENPYVSGIFSMAGRRHMGTSLTEILKNHPDYIKKNGGINYPKITNTIHKIKKADAAKSGSSAPYKRNNLRPLRNDQGDIVDFRVMMNHGTKKKLLRPDLEFQNVFANMQSTLIGRVNTVSVDKAVVDSLVWEQDNIMPNNPDLPFINILDKDSPFREQYLRLPREIREYMDKYTINGKFMINADQIDQVFGYSAPTVTNLKWVKKSPTVLKYARLTEYMTRQIVSYAKDRIVIATPAVVARNILSNTVNLAIRKIPFTYIAKKYIEGYSEYRRYTKDITEANALKARIEAYNLPPTSAEAKQYANLVNAVMANKMHTYSKLGLNSLIVEDVNTAATDGYLRRLQKWTKDTSVGNLAKKLPTSVQEAGKTLIVSKSSAVYRGLQHVVQLSDFLARYVMIEHAVNVKKQPQNVAIMEAIEAFVLFDENLTPALYALDSTGITIFTAYAMRNMRAVKSLVKEHPQTAAIAIAGDSILGIDGMAANILQGPIPSMFNHANIIDKATELTGYEIVSDLISN